MNSPHAFSLGYSKKGWTNGEIGVEWIKNFDKHTSAKAKHRYRRLTVDGHNSHYTRAFLEYARAHRIIVICYPSHATHVLQGLDVVIFAVLKRYISEERDRWERETGESVGKSNFLAIFGRAHIRALTPDLIKTAFRKTGISPFDRNVVSKDNMAPSKESSCEGRLPTVVAPEITALAKLMQNMSIAMSSVTEGEPSTNSNTPDNRALRHDSTTRETDGSALSTMSSASQHNPAPEISRAVARLVEGPLAYLVSPNTPITSESPTPPSASQLIHPPPVVFDILFVAKTNIERSLLCELRESEAREEALRRRVAELQAANVLNELYCSKLRGQLAHQDEQKKKKKSKGRLMADGLPCFLSGDEFYQKVVAHEEAQQREEREKEARKRARGAVAEAVVHWKKTEEARKERNKERKARYREAVTKWEAERGAARDAKKPFTMRKPAQEKLEAAVPRPKPGDVVVTEELGSEDDEIEDEDEDEDD